MSAKLQYMFAAFMVALALAAPAHAAMFTVNSAADTADANPGDGVCATAGALCTLRAAISEANALAGADTINIPAGTYQVTLFGVTEYVNASGSFDITGDVTITGAGSGTVTIDGNGFGGGDRAFYVAQNLTVSFSGVRIIDGFANDGPGTGGGIWVDQNSSVTITNSVINSCTAGTGGGGVMVGDGATLTLSGVEVSQSHADTNGGGVYVDVGATLTIQNSSTIGGGAGAGNESSGVGGGIYNNGGTVDVNGSTIGNNIGENGGGGMFNTEGAVTITNSTISDNDADDLLGGALEGGAIYNIDGSVTITNSTLSGNNATGNGGAIYSEWFSAPAPMSITGSTISGNTAGMHGGAILTVNASALTLTDSTLSGNTADFDGGALYHDLGPSTITGCVISGNTAADDGGGVINYGGLTVTNSTISGNTAADQGGGVVNNDTLILTGVTIARNSGAQGGGILHDAGTVTSENTIIADNGAGLDCSIWDVFTDNGGNLDSDGSCSTFTQAATMIQGTGFAALASNGGSTKTHALLAGSAALDAAPDCGGLAGDQRGYARPQNGTCDIGAYEARLLTVTVTKSGTGSVADTNTVTGFDISCGAACSDTVLEQSSVTLTATAGAGYYFSGWSGACSGTGNCTLSTITANKNVTATFSANPSSPEPEPAPEPEPEPADDGGDDTVTPPDPSDEGSYTPPAPTGGGSAPTEPVLSAPANGATVDSLIVTFDWQTPTDTDPGKLMSYLYICERDDFAGCESPFASDDGSETVDLARMLGATGVVVLFGLLGWRRDGAAFYPLPRGRLTTVLAGALLAAPLLMALTLASCGPSDSGSAKRAVAVTKELQPATTYYWKVMDVYQGGGVLASETRSFTTPAQ